MAFQTSERLLSQQSLTLHKTIPTFDNLKKIRLLKTWWEKEKMLVTSIFSFSHHVSILSMTASTVLLTFTINFESECAFILSRSLTVWYG